MQIPFIPIALAESRLSKSFERRIWIFAFLISDVSIHRDSLFVPKLSRVSGESFRENSTPSCIKHDVESGIKNCPITGQFTLWSRRWNFRN